MLSCCLVLSDVNRDTFTLAKFGSGSQRFVHVLSTALSCSRLLKSRCTWRGLVAVLQRLKHSCSVLVGKVGALSDEYFPLQLYILFLRYFYSALFLKRDLLYREMNCCGVRGYSRGSTLAPVPVLVPSVRGEPASKQQG